jgi:hypothetical protein
MSALLFALAVHELTFCTERASSGQELASSGARVDSLVLGAKSLGA